MAIGFKSFKGRAGTGFTKIRGLSKLRTSFDKLRNESETFMTREMHRSADQIARFANRDAPVKSGRLVRSINVKKRNKFAAVKVDAPYAGYVEEGTSSMDPSPKGGYIYKHIPRAMDIMAKNIDKHIDRIFK